MKKYPKSLIAKVLGIFRIQFDIGKEKAKRKTEPYNVIVMENL